MLSINSITYKNFLSSGDIPLTIDLSSNQITAIIGKNGTGKTSLIEAIYYALYGKSYRKVPLSNLVNSINKKNMLVELNLTVNNKNYLIRRGYKPKIFEIYQNNELIDQNKDYQEYLEKYIIKCNPKTFTQVVMLGSVSFTPFMELDAKSRRELIEDLLDLNIFSIMNSILKEKISSNKINIINNNADIKSKESSIESAIKAQNTIHTLYKDEIHKLKIENDNFKLDNLEIEDLLNELELNINKIDYDNDKLIKFNTHLTNLINSISNNNYKISELSKEIDFYNHVDTCSKCKQNIDIEFKTNIISTNTENINVIKNENLDIDKRIAIGKEKILLILQNKKEYDDLKNKLNNYKTKINNNNYNITKNLNKIKELNNLLSTETVFDFVTLNNELEFLKIEKNDLEQEKLLLDKSVNLLKDGGIKSLIIKKYIPTINSLINKYLELFDFYIKFELNENFEEKILSRHKDDFSYQSFSQGEKSRINLAILFAFRDIAKIRNTSNINLLIFDEVFESALDTDGVDFLMKILNTFDNNTNMFIITHNDSLKESEYFEKTIELIKVNNFTKIKN